MLDGKPSARSHIYIHKFINAPSYIYYTYILYRPCTTQTRGLWFNEKYLVYYKNATQSNNNEKKISRSSSSFSSFLMPLQMQAHSCCHHISHCRRRRRHRLRIPKHNLSQHSQQHTISPPYI